MMHKAIKQAWPYEAIFAHRGGGTLAPENTLGAIKFGYQLGFRAVEFDVMLAADAVPILMHDPVFGRTILASGSVPNSTSAELLTMDAGGWHSAKFAGEPVPSFKAVIAYCIEHRICMNAEIKPAPGFERETGIAVAHELDMAFINQQLPAAQMPLLSSFSEIALAAAQERAPWLSRGLLLSQIPDDWQAKLKALSCVALHCNHRALTQDLAKAIKADGYWLFCYTVNDPERARELFSWGIDALCTDRLDLIHAHFKSAQN
jgi:glycerophosphoryl diester phosphodiesterase